MAKTKVAVTLDSQTVRRVDRLVRDARYPNRSQAIEAAVAAQLERLEGRRLAEECGSLIQRPSGPSRKRDSGLTPRHGRNTEGRDPVSGQSHAGQRAGGTAECSGTEP